MPKELPALSNEELACIYGAAILADDDIPVTQEKLATILKAASVDVEPIWPMLYARALSGIDIRALISDIGSSASAPAAAGGATSSGGATAGGDPAADEEKKEDKPAESDSGSDDDMGFGLFD